MQDLHGDLAIGFVYAVGDDSVVGHVLIADHHCGTGQNGAFEVGADTACHHEAHTATRARSVEFGDTVPVFCLFQTGVHGPHEHAVFQRGEAQIKGGEHMGVIGHGMGPLKRFDVLQQHGAGNAACH